MKNKFLFFIILFLFIKINFSSASELSVSASKIQLDDNSKIIFLDGNVIAVDKNNNKLTTNTAKYNKKNGRLLATGETKIITSENYQVFGSDILFDDKNKIISSNEKSKILDKDGNQIFVSSFKYLINKNIFFSKGQIKIIDLNNNQYKFSEIYINEKERKIAGSDVRVFLNDESFKTNKDNEPRFFANSMTLSPEENEMLKGVFTYCKNRGKDKCPPWSLQSKKIRHSSAKKTIYYDNVVVKVYDFPILFFPKFWHPDPTVKRQSGFLNPTLSTNSTVGSGISLPYFWNISSDKDLTFKPKLYGRENPLLIAEYRQDFKNSFLIVDTGFTEGYKKTTTKKTDGARAHFFSKFTMDFLEDPNITSRLEFNVQKVSNSTYLKIHDVKTELVDNDQDILESYMSYNYQDDDVFFGAQVSAFENLTVKDNSRYEYVLPSLAFDRNIFSSEKFGFIDFSSSLEVKNFDVDKTTEFLVNDLNWKSNRWINNLGIENQILSQVKFVNYNASNTPKYKSEGTSHEVSGALGFLSKIPLYKNDLIKEINHLFTPKVLIRYAPGHMRRVEGSRLKYTNLYEIKKTDEIDVLEKGLSASIGFDYKKSQLNKDGTIGNKVFSFSAGQVITAEEDQDLPASSSLGDQVSDLVGESSLRINNNLSLDYKFAVDQNYSRLNYNEVGSTLTLGKTNFNFNYLQEKEHIGNQEYAEAIMDVELGDSGQLSFSTKRNLLTSSSEFYKLSYDYINDCLKAGLVFRREFYTDSDIEPEDSIMFRISLVPLADINAPGIGR